MRIDGEQRYLWRAVDQHSKVLDVPVQSRCNAKAPSSGESVSTSW